MKAWLIYHKKDAMENHSYIDWFIEEANKQQVDLKLIYRETLQIGIKKNKPVIYVDEKYCPKPDFVIIRVMEPTLQLQFEAMTIPTFNDSYVAQICNHKSLTYLEMSNLNIPIVPTYFLTKQALSKEPPLSFPFVVKEATGRGGQQVFLIKNKSQWEQASEKLYTNDILVQSTEGIHLGKDVRVFVIGTEIVAAVLRENDHDFRANFKLGGKASLFHLTPDMQKMIHNIINHFEFGLVGIDFLLHKDGHLIFNEIEDVVGSRILSETTNINLLEKYIAFIKWKMKTKGHLH